MLQDSTRAPEAGEQAEVSSRSELEAAYREHFGFVWRNARRLGCDDQTAEDVAHEVFLVLARRFSEFRHEANLRTWLFAVTYRVVQRLVRDRVRRSLLLDLYATMTRAHPARPPQERCDAGQFLRFLLSRLSEAQRVVYILAELEGMTSAEIGACLGLKTPTVDSRLRAARLQISRLLERERARGGDVP